MSYKKPILKSFYYPSFKESMPSLDGKTIVITGTTSGTGKIASHSFAEKGARVIMLNRASSRSKAAQELIKGTYPDADVMTIDCDLQDFASVQTAAD